MKNNDVVVVGLALVSNKTQLKGTAACAAARKTARYLIRKHGVIKALALAKEYGLDWCARAQQTGCDGYYLKEDGSCEITAPHAVTLRDCHGCTCPDNKV